MRVVVVVVLLLGLGGGWGLAAAADPAGGLSPEASRKIDPDALRKWRSSETPALLVEFRDPAIDAEVRGDLARRGRQRMDVPALNLRSTRYRELKARNLATLDTGEALVTRDYSQLPLALIRVRDEAALQRLLARPEVIAAYENRRVQPAAPELDLIGQPQAAQVLGQTGAGRSVVVLDTGVDYTGSAFGNCPAPLPASPPAGCKVAAALDLTLAYGNSPYPPVLNTPPYYPYYDDGSRDNVGHGTVVASTLLSAAPGVKIIAIDVEEEPPWTDFSGATADSIIAGIDWAISHQATYNIAAINISLAGGAANASQCATNNPLVTPVQVATAQGMVTVTASGNDGYADGLPWPGCTPGVLSVGAVYTNTSAAGCSAGTQDTIACFSDVASYLSLLTPAGATSFAAPLATAAIAVVAAAYPTETPAAWKQRLTATGKPVTDNRSTGIGYVVPRLDLAAALLYPSTAAPANDGFAAAGALAGDSGTTLGWNFHATRETGEPLHAGSTGGASVWWKWTAGTSGTATLDTHGSNFNTLLSVHTGSSLAALSTVASNDDDGSDGGVSGLSLHADAGTTYYIAVDGKAAATGDLYLNRSFSADPAGSANLSVTATVSPSTVIQGATLTYTLTVRNSGPAAAASVTISQALPAMVSFVSADAGCTLSGSTVNCAVGSLAAGGQAVRTVRVLVTATGTLSSNVQVSSSTTEAYAADNTATIAVGPPGTNGDVPLPAWALLLLAAGLLLAVRRAA